MLEPLFEAELDYQPGMPPLTSETVCPMAPVARITTGDSRYSWLHGALVLWEGEFNEATHHARYTAYLQPAAPAP